jgi:peptide-methionine (R)-S-oxide reductase
VNSSPAPARSGHPRYGRSSRLSPPTLPLIAISAPPCRSWKVIATAARRRRSGWAFANNCSAAAATPPLTLSSTEWKKKLPAAAFNVLREEGTEYAGSSPLNNEKRAGVFVCAGCDLPLFTSEMKYESGTGWPSFFTTIPGAFGTKKDHLLFTPRTEYHCARCGGHHGHVFDDGPAPTGQRWCNNGVALKFIPKTA